MSRLVLESHPSTYSMSTVGSLFGNKMVRVWNYSLTHSIVQSPSWAANWFAATQEIPHISRNPKVHYRTHKHPPPFSILGKPNPVHIPTSNLLEIHPNFIHPSTPRSPQWSLSLRFPHHWVSSTNTDKHIHVYRKWWRHKPTWFYKQLWLNCLYVQEIYGIILVLLEAKGSSVHRKLLFASIRFNNKCQSLYFHNFPSISYDLWPSCLYFFADLIGIPNKFLLSMTSVT